MSSASIVVRVLLLLCVQVLSGEHKQQARWGGSRWWNRNVNLWEEVNCWLILNPVLFILSNMRLA